MNVPFPRMLSVLANSCEEILSFFDSTYVGVPTQRITWVLGGVVSMPNVLSFFLKPIFDPSGYSFAMG